MVNYIQDFRSYQEGFKTALSRLVALNFSGKVESEQLETVVKAVVNKYSKVYKCQKSPNEHSYYDLIINNDFVSVKSGKKSNWQLDNALEIYDDFEEYDLDKPIPTGVFQKPFFTHLKEKSIIFFKKDVGHFQIKQFDIPKLLSSIDHIQYSFKKSLYEIDFFSKDSCLMCLKCSKGIQYKGKQSNAFQRGLWIFDRFEKLYPVIDQIDIKIDLKDNPTFEQFLNN